MTKYWIKIIVGALLIFGAGLALWLTAKKGVHTVRTVMETADPITIPIKFADFRVDGASIGKLEQVRLLRSAPKVIEGVEVTVRLDSAAVGERLRACTMRIDDIEHLDAQTTFVCVTPENPGAVGSFEPFGHVLIEGTDIVMPLLLPAAAVQDLKRQTGNGPLIPDVPVVPSVPSVAAPGADAGAEAATAGQGTSATSTAPAP